MISESDDQAQIIINYLFKHCLKNSTQKLSYPIIEVPTSLYFIAESGQSINKPTKPKFSYKEPELNYNTEGAGSILARTTLFIFGTIFLIAIFALFMEGESVGDNSGFFIPLIIVIIIAFIIVNSQSNKESEKRDTYDKAVDFYSTKKKEYDEKLTVYEEELATYQKKLRAKDKMGMDAYIRKSLFDYYKKYKHPPSEIHAKVKEGKTELTFYKLLRKYFGNKIKKNVGIINEDYIGDKTPYVPDIAYYNETSGICIDIEIDEKYSKDGILIHYEYSSHDEARNDFFLAHNWIVIRFAEQQILDDKEACAVTVIKTIQKYDPSFDAEQVHHALLHNKSEPRKVKRWSKPKSDSYQSDHFLDDFDDDLPF